MKTKQCNEKINHENCSAADRKKVVLCHFRNNSPCFMVSELRASANEQRGNSRNVNT